MLWGVENTWPGPGSGRAESQPCCRHGKRKNREAVSKGWTMWQGPCSGRCPPTRATAERRAGLTPQERRHRDEEVLLTRWLRIN